MKFKDVALAGGIEQAFEGPPTTQVRRVAVKDRRRGRSRNGDGHGCSVWQGIAVVFGQTA
jgi:hypothetical protein